MDYVTYYNNVVEEIVGEGITRKVLAFEDQMMMVEVAFDKGSVGAMHSHPHVQSTYVLEGEFEFTLGDKKVNVKKSDTLTIPSNLIHGTICLSKGILLDVFTPMRQDFMLEKK